MSRIAVKLLALLLVLVVSPLHASSRAPAMVSKGATSERLERVLGSLTSPLSAAAFFELVNGHSSYGYVVGNAQSGTQAMVGTIDLTLAGNDTATTPASGSNLDSFFDRYFDGLMSEPGLSTTGTTHDTTDRDSAVDDADNSGSDTTTTDSAVDDADDVDPAATDAGITVVDSEEDWYRFTVDQSAVPTTHLKTADDFDTGNWLYDYLSGELTYSGSAGDGAGLFRLGDLESSCGAAPTAPLCSEAGKVLIDGLDLMDQCSGDQSPLCDLLIEPVAREPGTYFIAIDGFGAATDGSFYSFTINDDVLDLCRVGEPDDACAPLQRFTASLAEFGNSCEGSSSDVCSGYQWPAGAMPTLEDMPDLYRDDATSDPGDAGSAPSGPETRGATPPGPAVASGPRTVRVTPGNDPGHFTLRETGNGSGIFEVVGEELYTFRVTDAGYMDAIFDELPPGSVLDARGYRVRRAPDGETLLLRHDDGSMFTYPRSPMAPDDYLTPLTADISDPNKTILTGPGGIRVVIPSPHVEHVDINTRPDAIATDPNDIVATENGNGPPIAALISSTGGSTGEVFDIQLVNFGKTAVITGDAIFELLTDEESAAARNAMARLMAATNNVSTAPGEAYCVEQDKAVPSTGELFRLADAGKQREFAFARQVLSGARAAEATGVLNPDSDPAAYVQSIRQWAIWTAEKSYDKDGFAESFVEHTRKTLEANGTEWNDQVEGIVRDLVDNRWGDVQKVLELAGPLVP